MKQLMGLHAILKNREVVQVTQHEWHQWFKDSFTDLTHPRHIGIARFGDVVVSTVFVGINQGFFGEDKWFETMIFGGEHDRFEERYETFDEAMNGFIKACTMLMAKCAVNPVEMPAESAHPKP